MRRDGQIVQIGDKGSGDVLDDLIPPAPDDPANPAQIHLPVHDGWFVTHLFVEHDLDFRRALVGLAFQVIEQIANGQIGLAIQNKIQGGGRLSSFPPGWG